MNEIANYAVQNGFAISVAIYLLYERTRFNCKITETLKEIAIIVKEICRK